MSGTLAPLLDCQHLNSVNEITDGTEEILLCLQNDTQEDHVLPSALSRFRFLFQSFCRLFSCVCRSPVSMINHVAVRCVRWYALEG